MTSPIFYNAHHSPVGAFATLTLGCKGPKGGLGLELGGPADESVYVGVENVDEPGTFRALPFFGGPAVGAADFDVEGHSDHLFRSAVQPFSDHDVARDMGAGVDTWRAGDLTFRIISAPREVPDPETADCRDAIAPAVLVELTVDNRHGSRPRKAFFGYQGSDRTVGMRLLDEPGLTGVGQGTSIAIATDASDVYAGLGWQPEAALHPRLEANLKFMLGSLGLIVGEIPAGEVRTFRYAVAFFREGTATTGLKTRYLYRRYFDRVEDVLKHALAKADETIALAEEFDARLRRRLSPERAWMAAHAIRSYFGSTMLLDREDGRPLWVVHEGEYRMMNTFDLTVDQAFFELAFNPWTVRNVLDLFVERYSYTDGVRFPGDPTVHPGGIAFTHDMGVANTFSRPGYSGYELSGLTGCFSYMSAEELMNWVLCAGLYVRHTGDFDWADRQRQTLLACLTSLQHRDNPEAEMRNGVVGLDGDRCAGGAEITTYDSLDASLGQARNNLYLAVKGWATYLLLADVLREIGEGVDSRIIPAIEGLVYPHVAGVSDEFSELRDALRHHFEAVLRPGVCKFADGGWRLSSTSRNSWLSKIYLCQYVAERVLGAAPDDEADRAHVDWLLAPENVYYAWSDQMLEGKAVGSRYYPRGVTSILWLTQGSEPIREARRALLEGEAVTA